MVLKAGIYIHNCEVTLQHILVLKTYCPHILILCSSLQYFQLTYQLLRQNTEINQISSKTAEKTKTYQHFRLGIFLSM